MLKKYRQDFSEAISITRDIHEDSKEIREISKQMSEDFKQSAIESAEAYKEGVKAFDDSSVNELLELKHSVAALGARWGTNTEESFRHGIEDILGEHGYIINKFREHDGAGTVFAYPSDVGIDIIVEDEKDGDYLLEIKSSMDRHDVLRFENITNFYETFTGRAVKKKSIISPFIHDNSFDIAQDRGINLFTHCKPLIKDNEDTT